MLRMLSISICRCDADTNRRFVQESCCHYLWPCWGRCVVSKLSFRNNAWNACIFLDNHTCVWLYTRFIFHACPRDMTTSFEAFKSFQAVEDPVQADSNYPITNRIFVDRQKKWLRTKAASKGAMMFDGEHPFVEICFSSMIFRFIVLLPNRL